MTYAAKVIEPVKLSLDKVLRPSQGMYWDAQGTLQTAPADEFRITYDPRDLTKLPRALVEGKATNTVRNNVMNGAALGVLPDYWRVGGSAFGLTYTPLGPAVIESGIKCIDIRVSGTVTSGNTACIFPDYFPYVQAGKPGEEWAAGAFIRKIAGTWNGVTSHYYVLEEYDDGVNYLAGGGYMRPAATDAPLREQFVECTRTLSHPLVTKVGSYIGWGLTVGAAIDFTVRIGLPTQERGKKCTSPIETGSGPVTREADVLPTNAALLYSSVPVTEPSYSSATTYAKGALVLDPATMAVYESLVAANLNAPLNDATKWLPRGLTNRWAAFDEYNNTQTSAANEIVMVISPKFVSQGFYVGNVDGSEVTVIVQDLNEGTVYTKVHDLLISDSGSSFFNWCFKRLRRRRAALSADLPTYANALVIVRIRNPGATAACGLCAVGSLTDIGLTTYGLGMEVKDYSTTMFNFDGTVKRTKRGYAKRLSVNVKLKNDMLDSTMELLAGYRQVNVVWVFIERYDWAAAFGTFASLKTVIENYPESDMALQIDGAV